MLDSAVPPCFAAKYSTTQILFIAEMRLCLHSCSEVGSKSTWLCDLQPVSVTLSVNSVSFVLFFIIALSIYCEYSE